MKATITRVKNRINAPTAYMRTQVEIPPKHTTVSIAETIKIKIKQGKRTIISHLAETIKAVQADSAVKNPYENGNSVFEYTQNGNEKQQTSGYSVASLVLGAISIVMCCNPLTFLGIEAGGIVVQFVCAVLAIVFGAKEVSKKSNGIAKAGLITGIVGIIFCIVQVIIFIICGMALWYSGMILFGFL